MSPDPILDRLERLVGTTLDDKYRLDALLGVGGMGAVYRATHRNGGQVAVKLLHAEHALDTHLRTRFLREGYVANKVGHPGVVKILDDDEVPDGAVFLVMDLLEGMTLEAHRKSLGGRVPVRQAIEIVVAVLDILVAAHAQRIVHRDIKPDNIFLADSGETRLMDFGIARLLDGTRLTGSNVVLGTPAFMSPEQAASRHQDVGAASDIWSVGAVLFALLTGEEVHPAKGEAARLIYAATQPARRLGQVLPSLPADLTLVVDTALAFDAQKRWPSATGMMNALRQVRAGQAPTPPFGAPPGPIPQVSVSSSPTLIQGSGDYSNEPKNPSENQEDMRVSEVTLEGPDPPRSS